MQNYAVNEVSLQGQFSSTQDFLKFFGQLLAVQVVNGEFIGNLLVSEGIFERKVVSDFDLRSVISQIDEVHPDYADLTRIAMKWLEFSRRTWKNKIADSEETIDAVYFKDVDVGESAIEFAVVNSGKDSLKLICSPGGDMECVNSQLPVQVSSNGLLKESQSLKIFYDIDQIKADMADTKVSQTTESWEDLRRIAMTDFKMLEFSELAFSSTVNQPFSRTVCDELYGLMRILNEYMVHRNVERKGNAEKTHDNPIVHSNYFGKESENNWKHYMSVLNHKGIIRRKNFEPWYGRNKVDNYRICFEWPYAKGRNKITLHYIGPNPALSGNSKKSYKLIDKVAKSKEKSENASFQTMRWKEILGFSKRRPPELYESENQLQNTAYALEIGKIMKEFPIEGVFCVQDKPEVVIFRQPTDGEDETRRLFNALWNQGLASILVVEGSNQIQIYSLQKGGSHVEGNMDLSSFILKSIEIGADGIFDDFILSLESGRLWCENPDFFDRKSHIEHVLLEDFNALHGRLIDEGNCSSEESMSLLVQTIFVACLEDRNIISKSFILKATDGKCKSLAELLGSGEAESFEKLFQCLRKAFKDDLFLNPFSLADKNSAHELTSVAMSIMLQLRQGMEKAHSQHMELFKYDFKYIPISIFSDIINRYHNLNANNELGTGKFFQPLPLVDFAIESVWKQLDQRIIDEGQFLDPYCGSGLFLVQCLQRICTSMKSGNGSHSWPELTAAAERIQGYGSDSSALKVAMFSIYLTILEFAPNSIISKLQKGEDVLPKLWMKTLVTGNYFDKKSKKSSLDVILGTPEWNGKLSKNESAVKWCEKRGRKLPRDQLSWAYLWKAHYEAKHEGIVAFILPASDFIYDNPNNKNSARTSLYEEFSVLQVADFTDFRNQLMEDRNLAASLFVFGNVREQNDYLKLEYVDPKADVKFQFNKSICTRNVDRLIFPNFEILNNPLYFQERHFMSWQERKLYMYLTRLPKLSEFVRKHSRKNENNHMRNQGDWIIGEGFQTYKFNGTPPNSGKLTQDSLKFVKGCVSAASISSFQVDKTAVETLTNQKIKQIGFARAYNASKILISKEISEDNCRLNAALVQEPLAFQDDVCAITFPISEIDKARFLTGILNSKLAFWWVFHSTSSVKAGWNRIQEKGILGIPFPEPQFFRKESLIENSDNAQKEIIQIVKQIENEISFLQNGFSQKYMSERLIEIDNLTYRYFGLSDNEISQIEDSLNYKLPAMNPEKGDFPKLWKMPDSSERRAYAVRLRECLSKWVKEGNAISVELTCRNDDYAVVRIFISDPNKKREYVELASRKFENFLSDITSAQDRINSNLQLIPSFRVFEGDSLYLIKPMQFRYWMESIAIEDTLNIAMDFQKHVLSGNN